MKSPVCGENKLLVQGVMHALEYNKSTCDVKEKNFFFDKTLHKTDPSNTDIARSDVGMLVWGTNRQLMSQPASQPVS